MDKLDLSSVLGILLDGIVFKVNCQESRIWCHLFHLLEVPNLIAVCPELLQVSHVLQTRKIIYFVVSNFYCLKIIHLQTFEVREAIVSDVKLLQIRQLVKPSHLADSVCLNAEKFQNSQFERFCSCQCTTG